MKKMNFKASFAAIAAILVVVAAASLAEKSPLQQWESKYGGGWKLELSDKTGLPSHISGGGIYLGEVEESNADEKARGFLKENKDVLGVDVDNLKLEKMDEDEPLYPNGSDTYVLSYRQKHGNLPVYGGYVNVFISGNMVTAIEENYYWDIKVPDSPSLNEEDAVKTAEEKFNVRLMDRFPAGLLKFPAELVIFPKETDAGITSRLAYMVDLPMTAEPLAMWTVFVDANSGEVLHSFNRIRYADRVQGRVSGSIFLTNPEEPQSTVEFPHETIFTTDKLNRAFHSESGISLMETPVIDLSQASSASLSFDAKHDLGPDEAALLLAIPSSNSILNITGEDALNIEVMAVYDGLNASWGRQSFDLSSYLGRNVSVAFVAVAPVDSINLGFFVDNVAVETGQGIVFSDDAESGISKWVTISVASQGFKTEIDKSGSSSGVTVKGDYRIEELAGSLTLFSSLSGPFVSVNSRVPFANINSLFSREGALHLATLPLPEAKSHDWDWAEFDTSYKNEESNAFYQVNIAHDYFTKGSPFDFPALDIPMKANMEVFSELGFSCNAFATGLSVNFFGPGEGPGGMCESTALGADIIYHEYTHNVVMRAYLTVPQDTGEIPAMHEGWADYFAASITNDPSIGEGVFENPIRIISNTKMYPDDIVGEPHIDSLPFSGAMWDLRAKLGKDFTDSLVIRAIKLQPRLFSEFLDDLLAVDDDDGTLSDGTPHIMELCNAFSSHGIKSDFCNAGGV